MDRDDPRNDRAAHREEEKRAYRRALRLGMIIWPSFFLLDVYMSLVVRPGAPILFFLACRVIGEAVLLGLWRAGNRPETDPRELRGSIRIMGGMAAFMISIMALHLGGLVSPYVHGLSIVLLVMSVMLPSPWRRSLTWLVPVALMFPAVMAAAAAWNVSVRAQWMDRDTVGMFLAHYVFVLAAAAIGSVSANLVWRAREQVYEARRLGRYRLKAQIGRGAMNEVWLAWDGALRRNLALKILRAPAGAEDVTLRRFTREARALSRLSSPHTVRVFDFGASDDGLYFIAMEYLDGHDLQQIVDRTGPFPPSRTIHVAEQICRSLAEVHEAGVVHRDIKPANILLTRVEGDRDFVKVVDFGIARLLEPDAGVTHTGVLAGTPHYIAPELWQGRQAHPGSDLYSLGAVLYFLLTGEEPFSDRARMDELAAAHMDVDPLPPSRRRGGEIPRELESIVLRCLSKEAGSRYAGAEELRAALGSCGLPAWTEADAAAEWARFSDDFDGRRAVKSSPPSPEDPGATAADTLPMR